MEIHNISFISTEKSYCLRIEHVADFNMVESPYIYFLSPTDVAYINDNLIFISILNNIIDKHLIKCVKNIRKRKLEVLNEIQT